jgi:hypothetical protein
VGFSVAALAQLQRQIQQLGQTPRLCIGTYAIFNRVLLDDFDHAAIGVIGGDPQMGALHVRIVDLDMAVRWYYFHQL